jgi:hypothetical protein
MLTPKTAAAFYNCNQQIERAEKLLVDVTKMIDKIDPKELRDSFGRVQHSLQLGIPSIGSSHYIVNVDPELAVIIIEAQIVKYKEQLKALNVLAGKECVNTETAQN